MPKLINAGGSGADGKSRSRLLSGTEAALRTLAEVVANVCVCSDTLNNGITFALPELQNRIQLKSDPVGALAYAAGLAATGISAGVFLESSRFSGVSDQISAAAARHLPLTIVISEPLSAGAQLSATGAQNSLTSVAEAGCPVLVAASVQELADFIVVARVVSSVAMLPVLVFTDGRDTAWTIQGVDLPGISTLEIQEDETSPLSTYRSMLFGRDAPEDYAWIDPTHPIGIGMALPDELALKVRTGRHVFVKRELASLVERTFSAFADQTGRSYSAVTESGAEGADVVLLASGSVAAKLRSIAKQIPSRGPSVGIVQLSQLRPFPIETIAGMFRNVASVGVLVSTSSDNLDDLALVRDVRSALQASRSAENSQGGRRRRKRGGRAEHRTVVSPVLYRAGWIPAEGEIRTLVQRLSEARRSPGLFVLGTRLSSTGIRAPEIERLAQLLTAQSVDFAGYETVSCDPAASKESTGVFVIAPSARETWQLLNQTSRLFQAAGVERVHAGLHPVSDATTHPVIGHVTWEAATSPFALVTRPSLLESLDVSRIFPRDAHLILGIPTEDPEIPQTKGLFPAWITERNPIVTGVRFPDRIGDDERLDEGQCLLAALVSVHPVLKATTPESIARADVFPATEPADLETLLDQLGEYRWIVERAPETGDSAAPPEDPPPADMAGQPSPGRPLADLDRFWKTTGYLYRKGRLQDVPVEPFLTSGALPARAGVLTTHAGELESIPRVIQERCTGCGACWSVCPESALGAQLYSVESLFDSAMESAVAPGQAFVQVPRLKAAIVKSMHRLVSRDDLHQFMTAESLITEASGQVVKKAGLDDEKRSRIHQEIDLILSPVAALRLVRTEMYFDRAEGDAKGTGLLLSIATDPDACTSCGLCYAACEEEAIEPCPVADFDPVKEWRACSELRTPQVSLDSIDDDIPSEYLPALLVGPTTNRVFRAGGADVGNLNRTVLKLYLESQNALSRHRLASLTDRIRKTIERIDARLQEQVRSVVEINDFAAFANALKDISGKLNPEKISQLAAASKPEVADREVDADPLAHLARLRGELSNWLERLTPTGSTAAHPHMILAMAMSERSFGLAGYPINPFAMPCISATPDRVSDLVGGLFDGMQSRYREILKSLDTANRIIEDVYDPSQDVHIDAHRIREISPDVLLVSDRFELDTARLLSSGRAVKVLIVSGGASIVDSDSPIPHPVRLALTIDDVYVHQISAEDPVDLLASLRRGLAHPGPVLFHIYSPDSVRDGVDADQALKLTRLASTSHVFPQILRIPGSAVRIVVEDGDEAGPAEWMLAQDRFAGHFRFVRTRDWSSLQMPIAEWLALNEEDRAGKEPFVERTLSDGRAHRFIAGPFATDFAQKCRASWNLWMSMVESPDDGALEPIAETRSAELIRTVDADALHTLSDRLLELSGFGSEGTSLGTWLADSEEDRTI